MHIAVLGGGPGGYSAAFEAARLGAEVTLIERERLGGTCLNRGCVPTKAILRSARVLKDARAAEEFGLAFDGGASVDVDALRARKEGIVSELVGQIEGAAKRLKVEVVSGQGRLTAPRTIEVALADGGVRTVSADAVILATGSVVFELPGIDHGPDGVWTSDDAIALSGIPPKITIIGGGVIGLEFACAYAAFGSTVHVVELTPQVLPGNDKRVVRLVQQELEGMGVAFHLGDAVESVERRADGRMLAHLKSGAMLESDVVMSAVGRVPNSSGFGFEEVGLEFDRRAIKVDGHFRTSLDGVFAIGDLIGGVMLAHVAEEEGVAAARNAAAELSGKPAAHTVDPDCLPACVYTFPEVATVGMSRDSAKERGLDAVQVVAKFAGNGKALAEGEGAGFVQLVAEKGTGRVLGCQIVGPHAVEIIHEVALCIHRGVTVGEVAHMVHAHPTVSEVVKAAAADAAGKI
ncbi:MAG: dihydrolipoyl dehydrogenase [Coriobacteriia bacterium]|nr:dihydrolipoyl dehydrogenase [Coriobacteriia bacterium]